MLRTLITALIGIALVVLAVTGVIPGPAGIVLGVAGAGIALTNGGRRIPGDPARDANPHGGAAEALPSQGASAAHAAAHHGAMPPGGYGGG
ncbi:MAG TPA: hypothetical protein VFN55_12725 [Solirubrobacteraceae bacterium]|nr:hypothetical protein [Solirubrobacteraceae bacterium]